MPDLAVAGLVRLSTCDWPGELVATVFTQGCPWACPYCHNPHLRPAAPGSPDAAGEHLDWEGVLAFLETRRGLLDGVVISGGEPLLQPGLADALGRVRELGFKTALHTGGFDPARLVAVLAGLDWVGIDAKAPFEDYASITGVEGSGEGVRTSIAAAVASPVELEVRTTVHPDLLDAGGVERLGVELTRLGVERWVLQPYRPDGVADGLPPAPRDVPVEFVAAAARAFPAVVVRT